MSADASNDQSHPLPPDVAHPPVNEGKRSKMLIWLTAAFLLIGLLWLLLYLLYFQFYSSTDDAYVNGNLISINVAVPGSVVAFYADDTDLVQEGQLLVELDRTEASVIYQRELASLASTVLQVRQLYENVKVNEALVSSRKIALSRAEYDFKNRQPLVDSLAISKEDFTHAQDTLNTAKHDLEQAIANLEVAHAAAGNTSIEQHPQIITQKERIRQAYYTLRHCSIYAPATGYVAMRNVDVGEWATTTRALMSIIPIDYMWVDANYKETQLTHVRIGQPATVTIDLYGSRVVFEGKVLGIASGTGSVFSIIPPQNATGNWIKIVQRLPVRIGLDVEMMKKYPLRLGLSAYTTVDISETDLPMLAPAPVERIIGKTNVFDISFDEVDALMDSIIEENMRVRDNDGNSTRTASY